MNLSPLEIQVIKRIFKKKSIPISRLDINKEIVFMLQKLKEKYKYEFSWIGTIIGLPESFLFDCGNFTHDNFRNLLNLYLNEKYKDRKNKSNNH